MVSNKKEADKGKQVMSEEEQVKPRMQTRSGLVIRGLEEIPKIVAQEEVELPREQITRAQAEEVQIEVKQIKSEAATTVRAAVSLGGAASVTTPDIKGVSSQQMTEMMHLLAGVLQEVRQWNKQRDLQPNLQSGVALSQKATYVDIMDKARRVEHEEERSRHFNSKKRVARGGASGRRPKRQRIQPVVEQWARQPKVVTEAPTASRVSGTSRQVRHCYACGRQGHTAQCCRTGTVCYYCHQPGHVKANCPDRAHAQQAQNDQRSQAQATMQAVAAREAQEVEGVLTGTIFTLDQIAHALLDSGTTHSFTL